MALAPFNEQDYGIDSEIRFCSISLSFRKGGCIRSLLWSVPVILPKGWHFATALSPNTPWAVAALDGPISFQTVSLEQLVDSPLLSGRYFREVALAPEITPKHYLDMVADKQESLQINQAHVDQLSNLVRQTGILFRSRHYNSFRMLVTLSDHISGNAFDHHQSLDNRRPANFLTNERSLILYGNFIAHDFAHSWNGRSLLPWRRTVSGLGANSGNKGPPP